MFIGSKVERIPDDMKKELSVGDIKKSIDEDEGESSSSATQSTNTEDFLNSNTVKECKRTHLDPGTNSGSQLKRLKTNTADYTGNETKSMMVSGEGTSGEKENDIILRIMNYGNNNLGSRSDQEPSASHIKNLNMGTEGEDISLLHPWIQRWCKNKAVETGGAKGTSLEKQFPSIAAMALLGKALSLTPTGRKKTNSVFVWNAKDLR